MDDVANKIKNILKKKGETKALNLLEEMLILNKYDTELMLNFYSTTSFRELVLILGLGNYWSDLSLANKIDSIDSAVAAIGG